jgi:hypothetical protein
MVARPIEEPEPTLFETPPEPLMKEAELEDLQKIITPPAKKVPAYLLKPTLVQELKDTKYKNFTIDLGTARTREPLGLRDLGIVANTMTIIKADSPFYYILNDPSNDPTPAEKGFTEDQFDIEEIYITNEAATGEAIIRVNWTPYLIRLR